MQRPSAQWSSAAVARGLVAAVLIVDLFTFGIVGKALQKSWLQNRQRAVVATQNLSAALEQHLVGLVEKIDLALLAVADEHAREATAGAVDCANFEAFIERQHQRLPELDSIRTTDARGNLGHGDGIRPDSPVAVADRPYFVRLRDDPGAGLVVSRPVIGRTNGKPEIVLGRAIRRPDGSFAGAALAAVALDELAGSFAAFDVGRSGVLVLRDDQLGLVVRRQPGGLPVALGSRVVSPELLALVREGRSHATYVGVAVDGIERTFTFRKVSTYPLYVIVGLAFDDYLGEWRAEVGAGIAIASAFALLTALAAVLGYRYWRRREAAIEARAEQARERGEMQARVQVAERMALVGTLAAGVAHEVNNPLTYVLSNVRFALDQLRETEPAWSTRPGSAPLQDAGEALAEALRGADRVRLIVRDLKTFSRSEGDRIAAVEVNPIVEGCLRMTASVTTARARIVQHLGEVPPVRASEARLGQVLLNLLVNAADAIPEGHPRSHEIAVATAVAADGRVEIEVRDTGEGIPPAVLSRIFDPFFTTKPVGHGTGLGLSICHGIVTALGGEIRVESAVGRGSRFRVLLPVAAAGEGAPAEEAAAEERGASGQRVLVLDDDPLVARAVARMIGGGCAVEVVTAPLEALARVSGGERWDVILCDLMMPGATGMEVHARIEAIDPALATRMIFMTGGAFTPEAREFLERVPNARLEKPIDRSALAEVLGTAVERSGAG